MDYLPEDSAVFLVLTHRPQKPDVVVSSCCHYEVRRDGTIDWRLREK